MGQCTEMPPLVSLLFRTFLNPLKFLMKIFIILVISLRVPVSVNYSLFQCSGKHNELIDMNPLSHSGLYLIDMSYTLHIHNIFIQIAVYL